MSHQLEINTLFEYAFTAYQAGMYKIAIKKFTELQELDPEYHSMYLYLAKSYEHEEEIDQALKDSKRRNSAQMSSIRNCTSMVENLL